GVYSCAGAAGSAITEEARPQQERRYDRPLSPESCAHPGRAGVARQLALVSGNQMKHRRFATHRCDDLIDVAAHKGVRKASCVDGILEYQTGAWSIESPRSDTDATGIIDFLRYKSSGIPAAHHDQISRYRNAHRSKRAVGQTRLDCSQGWSRDRKSV